ncbi:unnamed protein product [Symbiodinium natans]|uniref:Uncharacterized protein n=1 Tax=Symbiodinium natans TaxID=878477 RepID=A0A812GGC6_9DINO|nr:unnamed protein product [Symbiodinium natans]
MVVLQIDQFCECLHRSWDNYQAAQSFAHRYVRVMTKLVAVTDLWRFDLAGEDCEDCDGQCPEDAATRSRGFRAHSKSSSGSGLSGLSQFWKRKASPVPASFSQVKPAPMLQ